jgi:hypothetical protein
MPINKAPQLVHHSKPPFICPKPYCNSTSFIPHEDGWQCLNCMKIIYRHQPLPYIANNRPERVGRYDFQKTLEVTDDAPKYSYSDSGNPDSNFSHKQPVTEGVESIEDESWDWYSEYHNTILDILTLPGIYRLVRIKQLIRNDFT